MSDYETLFFWVLLCSFGQVRMILGKPE